MHQNRLVTENIAKLRQDVKAATTQDHLLAVIKDVEQHVGPLDYKDPIMHGLKWFLIAANVLGFLFIFLRLGYEWADFVAIYLIDWSSVWLPIVSLALLFNYGYEKGWYPIALKFNLPLLAGVMASVVFFFPVWNEGYWAFMYGFGYVLSMGDIDERQFSFMLWLTITSCAVWFWLDSRANWRKHLSERIFYLDALFDNQLKEIDEDPAVSLAYLQDQFKEFHLGNGARDLLSFCEGEHQWQDQGKEQNLHYYLFNFEFTEKKTKMVSDGKGGYKSKNEDVIHNRYGIILDFPYQSELSIDGYKKGKYEGEEYETESNAFNKLFDTKSIDPISAALFLKPAVIASIMQFEKKCISPTIEVNRHGRICISSSSKLIVEKPKQSLLNPATFYKEIAKNTELVRVKRILGFATDLVRYNDNNFKSDS
ncbi:hypothetical protein VIBRN418_15963 [Vibrio sp. N418]|uniref:DUF3137 domain-containing protein n=1 Tax=Vibrio sp. (strain N418) TaxID=701176 RepID=UPI00021C0424|nr:DUF3137 domain-containing protein [Vibrio sp. N418]EGU33823.1 hypothetical protein VIBRN418_15963 [Vibrio sp. N418]